MDKTERDVTKREGDPKGLVGGREEKKEAEGCELGLGGLALSYISARKAYAREPSLLLGFVRLTHHTSVHWARCSIPSS